MTDDTNLEHRIRERAFQIWLEEGKPEGREKEHWEQATNEVLAGTAPPQHTNGKLPNQGEGMQPRELP